MELYEKIKEQKHVLKMVVLGDVGVGKTNIIRRIIGENFEELEPTIGVEFAFYDIDNIDPEDPNKKISIQIWDTCIKIYINIKISRSRKI
jgi:GTPase SAR1 family protein